MISWWPKCLHFSDKLSVKVQWEKKKWVKKVYLFKIRQFLKVSKWNHSPLDGRLRLKAMRESLCKTCLVSEGLQFHRPPVYFYSTHRNRNSWTVIMITIETNQRVCRSEAGLLITGHNCWHSIRVPFELDSSKHVMEIFTNRPDWEDSLQSEVFVRWNNKLFSTLAPSHSMHRGNSMLVCV